VRCNFTKKSHLAFAGRDFIFKERMTGIEPALSVWKTGVLPLNYIRIVSKRNITRNQIRFSRNFLQSSRSGQPDSNRRPSVPKTDALPSCAMPRKLLFAYEAKGNYKSLFRVWQHQIEKFSKNLKILLVLADKSVVLDRLREDVR
jgi:hypothetical protein